MAGLTLRGAGGTLALSGGNGTLRLGHNGGSTSLAMLLGVGPTGPVSTTPGPTGPQGSQGVQGPQGLPGVNAVANDTATAGYVTSAGSATDSALKSSYTRLVERPVSILSNTGVDSTGVSDSSAGIQAVLDAAGARPIVLPQNLVLKFGTQLKLNSNQTIMTEAGASVPNAGGVVLNWTGPNSTDAIVMKSAPSQSSRVRLEGFRLNDSRTGATAGSGINIQFAYNNIILRHLVVGQFASDAVIIGAPAGGSSDCVILDDLWVFGKRYGLSLSRIDNTCSVRDVKGDSYAASGGSMAALVKIDSVSGFAAAFDLSSLKLETDTGTHLLHLGANFFGALTATGLVMRGHTANAGGDVVRIDNNDTQNVINLFSLITSDGVSSPVAVNLVNNTAAVKTWGAAGKRMTSWQRSANKVVYFLDGLLSTDTGASFSSGSGTPEGAVTAARGSIYQRDTGTGGFIYWKATGTGSTGWVQFQASPPVRTAAQIQSATDTCNTINKFQGSSMVFDSTTNKPLWASGSTATSAWKDATGTTVYTPV